MSNERTYSISVGFTVSPKPYESVRVDMSYNNVMPGDEELAVREGQPVLERLFAAAMSRALIEVENAKNGMYENKTEVTNAEGDSAILAPGSARPSRGSAL